MTTTLPRLLADQLPPDLSSRAAITRRLTTELDRFGYLPVNTPLVEHADLFLIKAGDAAINRLVSFDLAGQVLCLRPEFTAPAARVYIEHFQEQPGAVRLQFSGAILQHESLKHGELTQQDAIGGELVNETSAAADAEVIALTAQLLHQAGVDEWKLTLGHSGFIERFITRYGLDRQMRRYILATLPTLREGEAGLQRALSVLEEYHPATPLFDAPTPDSDSTRSELALQTFLRATPQRGPSGGRTQEEIARRLLDKQLRTDQRARAQQALSDLQHILAHATTPARLVELLHGDTLGSLADQIVETLNLLAAYDLPRERISLDLTFTRNLDYYTGIVFEFRTEAGDLLGGGGRYDELVGLLGAAQHVPAVGFMLYLDSVLRARPAGGTLADQSRSPWIVLRCLPAARQPAAIHLATELRAAGFTVATDFVGAPCPPVTTHMLVIDPDGTLRLLPADTPDRQTVLPPGTDATTIIRMLEAKP